MPPVIARDRHQAAAYRINRPVLGGFAITPNDTNDLQEITLSVWVGGAGSLKVTLCDNSTVTYTNVPVGRQPLRVKRVWAAGTTATSLIGEV